MLLDNIHFATVNMDRFSLEDLRQFCLGCKDCQGVCAALIELIGVPELILSTEKPTL